MLLWVIHTFDNLLLANMYFMFKHIVDNGLILQVNTRSLALELLKYINSIPFGHSFEYTYCPSATWRFELIVSERSSISNLNQIVCVAAVDYLHKVLACFQIRVICISILWIFRSRNFTMVFTDKFLTLNNDRKMPALGLGTWQVMYFIHVISFKTGLYQY